MRKGYLCKPLRGGIDELRTDIRRMMDIEAIKQLKHAYFRCIETANLEELATLFHDDVSVHFIGSNYEWKLSSRQEYMEAVKFSSHNESSVGVRKNETLVTFLNNVQVH